MRSLRRDVIDFVTMSRSTEPTGEVNPAVGATVIPR